MPQALPLTRRRYVQYHRSGPEAPRREIARTHEIEGKRRRGLGVAYRLFGAHGVVLGRWSPERLTLTENRLLRAQFPDWDGLTDEQMIRAVFSDVEHDHEDGVRSNNWGRLITPDEFDDLAARFSVEKMREGYRPGRLSWRHYANKVVPALQRSYLVRVNNYNSFWGWRLTPVAFCRVLWWRLRSALTVDGE